MKQKIKSNYPIILILLLAGFLYLYGLWNAGFANQYYAAGVYSMGERLHAFLFNSLDSVGFITIDKPPLGFWIQVIFTKAFGFSGFVLLLPQAICGVLSVYFIYRIISKRYGKTAGYVSALVLALTPIFVATSRNNTIDGILILMLVLAADQAIKAAEKSSMKHLIFAGIWIGLGFNVKMLQAFMIVPAIYLVFLLFSKQKIVKRLLSIVVSVIILLVISLSWVMIVDLVPEDDRPYVGSSDNNSAVELVLGHNGVSRILGRGGSINKALQPQNAPQGQNKPQLQGGNTPNIQRPPRPSGQNGQLLPKSGVGQQPTGPGSGQLPSNLSGQNNLPNQNNGFNLRSPGGETGEASIVRLFNQNNAGQISWLLLPAMVIALASLYWIFKKKIREEKKFITLFFFAMSLIPMFIYFSYAEGITHRYYFAMMASSIAALIGIMFVKLHDVKKIWIPIIFVVTACVQLYIHSLYTPWLSAVTWICAGVFVLTLIAMLLMMKKAKAKTMAYLLAVLLILPAIWSLTPVIYSDNSQLPIAGPELVNQRDSFDKQMDMTSLIDFLKDNREDAIYLALTPSSMSIGAELILQSEDAVMVLGGFNGGDMPFELDEFIIAVDSGMVRYALLSNIQNANGSNAMIYQWIVENAREVPPRVYGGVVANIKVFDMWR